MVGFIEFIRTNFSHVAPILAAGIFALAIILERYRALYLAYPLRNSEDFFERIQELVLAGKTGDAVSLCERYSGKPVAQIVKKGLLRAHQPESLIENGLEIAVEDAVERIQRRTSFLAMVANVATLLGLLGTIMGLINSFEAVGSTDAQQKAALLAKGISQAMNHTMLGLSVAIPCMVAFSFLMNRANRHVSAVESAAAQVMDTIRQRYYQAETTAIGGNNPLPPNPNSPGYDRGVA